MWKYNGIIYENRKELKLTTGLSANKIKAKLKDGEILFINNNHTEALSYETIYSTTKPNN